jgi:polyisoprenoid-binding protein YceI
LVVLDVAHLKLSDEGFTVSTNNRRPIRKAKDAPQLRSGPFRRTLVWRGTFKKTTGKVTLDAAAQSGSVDIAIDTASIDLAHDKLNGHVSSPEILDVAKFPTALYSGTFGKFSNGAPTEISGNLTLHGITKPLSIKINSFKWTQHPMLKNEVCGADASGMFNRADFGVNYGQQYGFKQDVMLRIQVEAIKAD